MIFLATSPPSSSLSCRLLLVLLLRDLDAFQLCNPVSVSSEILRPRITRRRTRRQRLLELIRLLGVLQNQGVQILLAPDLELALASLLVLLNPARYKQ